MQNDDLKNNAPIFWPWGVFLFAIFAAADLLSKHLAHNVFRNYLFAFSLPVPEKLIYLIYVLVLAGMVYYLTKNYHKLSFVEKFAWLIIFTGAFLNIGERIILGYVRDFIYITFSHWTGIYNVADFYIIIGIIVLIFFYNDKNEQKLKK